MVAGKGVFCGHAARKKGNGYAAAEKSDIPLQTVPPATAGTRECAFFTFGRIAAPRQRLRNRRRGLTVAQTPRAAGSAEDKQPRRGNSTAGKNLRYSVLRDISRLCFIAKSIIGAEPLHLQRVREVRKIGNLPY